MALDAGKIVEFGKPNELLEISRDQGRQTQSISDESGGKDAFYETAQ